MSRNRLSALLAVFVALVLALGAGPLSTPKAEAARSNAEVAFRYFVAKGLPAHQAAGVVGNLMQESSPAVDPKFRERGGPGRGIAQWTAGGSRWNRLVAYARKGHRSPWALQTQLDFIWLELHSTEKRAYNRLRRANSVSSATVAFSRHYERCGLCRDDKRIKYARAIYRSLVEGKVATRSARKPVARKAAPRKAETSFPTTKFGQRSPAVRTLQHALNARGQRVRVTGTFGHETRRAVAGFQRRQGLRVTGVVDARTWRALLVPVEPGSKGAMVKALQSELRTHGHPNLPVIGVFGRGTRADVIAFQRANGLRATGGVNLATWAALVD